MCFFNVVYSSPGKNIMLNNSHFDYRSVIVVKCQLVLLTGEWWWLSGSDSACNFFKN